MNYFKNYSSASVGAGANQTVFFPKDGEVRVGIAFFKIAVSGSYNYSLLFSDVMDSTYADGSVSVANMNAGGYKIHSLSVSRTSGVPTENGVKLYDPEKAVLSDTKVLTFDSHTSVEIKEGETVSTDPVSLTFEKGEYIAIKMEYSGKRIPCHIESMLPIYNKTAEGWEYSPEMPLPLMIGCDKKFKARIGYLGDSITQGIGAGLNTYEHWCARIAEMIGDEYSHYNLGIGYSRAADAATDGVWLSRAKEMDIVFLCLGTNDVAHDQGGAKSIASSLKTILCKLKDANCRIILQTAPPFDRVGERRERWFMLNDIILNELSSLADITFDNVPPLRFSEEFPEKSKYGGHPNAEGCKVWAEELFAHVKDFIFNI